MQHVYQQKWLDSLERSDAGGMMEIVIGVGAHTQWCRHLRKVMLCQDIGRHPWCAPSQSSYFLCPPPVTVAAMQTHSSWVVMSCLLGGKHKGDASVTLCQSVWSQVELLSGGNHIENQTERDWNWKKEFLSLHNMLYLHHKNWPSTFTTI